MSISTLEIGPGKGDPSRLPGSSRSCTERCIWEGEVLYCERRAETWLGVALCPMVPLLLSLFLKRFESQTPGIIKVFWVGSYSLASLHVGLALSFHLLLCGPTAGPSLRRLGEHYRDFFLPVFFPDPYRVPGAACGCQERVGVAWLQ